MGFTELGRHFDERESNEFRWCFCFKYPDLDFPLIVWILQNSFRIRNKHWKKRLFIVGDFQISLLVPILEPEVGEFGLFGHTYAHQIKAYKISSRWYMSRGQPYMKREVKIFFVKNAELVKSKEMARNIFLSYWWITAKIFEKA